MVDIDLLNRLDEEGLIDKRHVLWWQLGYEGRRVFSEEEFNSGLQKINHGYRRFFENKPEEVVNEEFSVWTRNDVPILIRDIPFREGLTIPCFISVKPMSHAEGGDGWTTLESARELEFPFTVYNRPHIRGVAIEVTNEFLFWYPLLFNHPPDYYATYCYRFDNPDILPALVCPIHPSKFYRNLIRDSWSHGRRPQKKAKGINCDDSRKIVPYYEFNPGKNNLTIYPAKVFEDKDYEDRLDLPVIISGDSGGIPKILGVGYFDFSRYKIGDSGAYYWELDKGLERRAKSSLIKRLGFIKK